MARSASRTSDRTPPGRVDVASARTLALTALSIEVAILAATGIALFFVYRPTAPPELRELGLAGGRAANRLPDSVRWVHRLTSRMAIPTALVAASLVALSAASTRDRWRRGAGGVAMGLAALAASVTGFLLPWDQLALWAVAVGEDLRGFRPLFNDQVRFVLREGVEISTSTLLDWLFVHIGLGTALAVLVALAWRTHRPRSWDERPYRWRR